MTPVVGHAEVAVESSDQATKPPTAASTIRGGSRGVRPVNPEDRKSSTKRARSAAPTIAVGTYCAVTETRPVIGIAEAGISAKRIDSGGSTARVAIRRHTKTAPLATIPTGGPNAAHIAAEAHAAETATKAPATGEIRTPPCPVLRFASGDAAGVEALIWLVAGIGLVAGCIGDPSITHE